MNLENLAIKSYFKNLFVQINKDKDLVKLYENRNMPYFYLKWLFLSKYKYISVHTTQFFVFNFNCGKVIFPNMYEDIEIRQENKIGTVIYELTPKREDYRLFKFQAFEFKYFLYLLPKIKKQEYLNFNKDYPEILLELQFLSRNDFKVFRIITNKRFIYYNFKKILTEDIFEHRFILDDFLLLNPSENPDTYSNDIIKEFIYNFENQNIEYFRDLNNFITDLKDTFF